MRIRIRLLPALCLLSATLAVAQSTPQPASVNLAIAANNSTQSGIHQQNIRTAESACGNSRVKFKIVRGKATPLDSPIAPGQARVIVIESQDETSPYVQYWMEGRPTVRIGLNGQWVGATKGRSYIAFPVNAGVQHLCANWQGISIARLDAIAGEEYFFLVTAKYIPDGDGSIPVLNLEPVNKDQEKLLIAESVPASFTTRSKKKKSSAATPSTATP